MRLGLLTPAELAGCIQSEYNPVRVGFKDGQDLWVDDCLNVGVCPRQLIALLRERFEGAGGVVLEHAAFKAAEVSCCDTRWCVVCGDGGCGAGARDMWGR